MHRPYTHPVIVIARSRASFVFAQDMLCGDEVTSRDMWV